MKHKSILLTLITFSLLFTFCFSMYQSISFKKNSKEITNVYTEIRNSINDTKEQSSTWSFSHDSWNHLKEQNNDFVGYIQFDNELIEFPVVQGMDNDYYLNHGFISIDGNNYSGQGTPFLDVSNSLDDMNLVIYGHNVYYDDSAMFTPLTKLIHQENYDNNHTIHLFLENEVRTYEIAFVYYFDVNLFGIYDYQQRNFYSSEEFTEWLRIPYEENLIRPINIPLEFGDNLLTLQTCKTWDDDYRLLVVCVETNRENY